MIHQAGFAYFCAVSTSFKESVARPFLQGGRNPLSCWQTSEVVTYISEVILPFTFALLAAYDLISCGVGGPTGLLKSVRDCTRFPLPLDQLHFTVTFRETCFAMIRIGEDMPDTIERTQEEIAEIERHKYFLSEKAGCDVGWEHAAKDWDDNFAAEFRKSGSDRVSETQCEPSGNGISMLFRRLFKSS